MFFVVPGYISRSVAGSYDNEGIAIFALMFTYYLWVCSLVLYHCMVFALRGISEADNNKLCVLCMPLFLSVLCDCMTVVVTVEHDISKPLPSDLFVFI